MTTKKPKVIINPKQIEPNHDGHQCEICTMAVAPLQFNTFDEKGETLLSAHFICSLCLLYESPWGKRLTSEIRELVSEMEQSSGEKFLRGPTGNLLLAADADMAVGAIAVASEMMFAMARGELDPTDVYNMATPPDEITPAKLIEGRYDSNPFSLSASRVITDPYSKP